LSSSPVNKIIYAPNVHQGGGKTLLLPILDALKDEKNILAILDERLQLPDALIFSGKMIRTQPTMMSRLLLEYRLWHLVKGNTRILCMGSLPPLWARSDNITVFVQNRYLLEKIPLSDFPLWIRLRIQIERWWLQTHAFRVAHFVVQTPTMRHLLSKKLWRDADTLPYYSLPKEENKAPVSERRYDFLYVASGEPHKNHRTLIQAWVIMSKNGKYPSLCLTLDPQRFPDLCAWIDMQRQQFGLKIIMVGELTRQGVQELYCDSKALIYPSSFESFGLPLLEAALAGLPITAADVDYVYEMIIPTASFDPYSPESIAASVINIDEKPAKLLVKPLDVESFLTRVL